MRAPPLRRRVLCHSIAIIDHKCYSCSAYGLRKMFPAGWAQTSHADAAIDAALRSAGGGTGGPPAAGSLDERVALLLSVGEEWSVPRRHSGLHLGSRLDAAADAHQRR